MFDYISYVHFTSVKVFVSDSLELKVWALHHQQA
jgi:hypothetical protein